MGSQVEGSLILGLDSLVACIPREIIRFHQHLCLLEKAEQVSSSKKGHCCRLKPLGLKFKASALQFCGSGCLAGDLGDCSVLVEGSGYAGLRCKDAFDKLQLFRGPNKARTSQLGRPGGGPCC